MVLKTKPTFPREIGLKRKKCDNEVSFKRYVKTVLGKASCYTSLYSFQTTRKDKPWRFDYTSAIIDKAWWDFDGHNDTSIDQVKDDVAELIKRLDGNISLVATGRGFHVYQFFNRSVVGASWRRNLKRYERKMAKGLKTLDGIGSSEKLVRIPNTFNPKGRKWAIPIDARLFSESPHDYIIPLTPQIQHFEQCPILHPQNTAECFDLVQWVCDNPEPVESPQNATERINFHAVLDDEIPIPPCIDSATRKDSPTHYARLSLVQHLSEELRFFNHPDNILSDEWDRIESEIFKYIQSLNWNQFNEHRTREGIRTNMKYKQSPTCKALRDNGMCVQKCWRYDGTF